RQRFFTHASRLGELSQLLGSFRVQHHTEAADPTVDHADHGARMGTPRVGRRASGEEAGASSPERYAIFSKRLPTCRAISGLRARAARYQTTPTATQARKMYGSQSRTPLSPGKRPPGVD